MALELSSRHIWVLQSEIRNMSIECERVGGINLSQGVCDTEVPPVVRRGAQQAIEDGINTYTHYAGLPGLRRAIAAKTARFTDLRYDPDREVVVSAGATGALYCACLALLDPGDEVICFEPYYGYHIQTLVATGAVPVYVRLHGPDWSFAPEDVKRAITARSRGLLINTPANPTGKVFTVGELEALADIAGQADLFVFTDEIYEHFLYDGRRHRPPALIPGMRERTITISGLSKTFSITGWRIGYCLCDARWAQAIGFFNDLVYVCAPAPLQAGVARGLDELGPAYYGDLVRQYTLKRDLLCGALQRGGLTPHVPQGAYYILADLSVLTGKTGKERAMNLLQRTGVACVPGEAFFHDGSGGTLGRFCFAKEDDVLAEACRRLERLR